MIYLKNDFKTIQFAIYFTNYDKKDTRSYRFLLPKLLVSHTNNLFIRKEMSIKLEELYGAYFKYRLEKIGNLSAFSVILTVVDGKAINDHLLLDQALDLLKDVLFDRKIFNEEIFNEEKRMLIEELETIKDKKRLYAQHMFVKHFFDNDLYGYPLTGTLKDIKSLTKENVEKYYHEVLLNDKIQLVVNGNLDLDEEIKIKNFFINQNHLDIKFETIGLKDQEVKIIKEKTKMNQAIIKLGYLLKVFRNDDLYEAANLLDIILGGYPESRLFKEIRENLGLCYDISSNYDFFKGTLMISSGVDLKRYEFALDEIKKVVSDTILNGVRENELRTAKTYYEHQIKSSLDQQSVLTKRAYIRELLNFNETIEEKLFKIKSVNLNDMNEVLKKIKLHTIYVLHGELND